MSTLQDTFIALSPLQLKAREEYLLGKKETPTRIYATPEQCRNASENMLRAALSCNNSSFTLV